MTIDVSLNPQKSGFLTGNINGSVIILNQIHLGLKSFKDPINNMADGKMS